MARVNKASEFLAAMAQSGPQSEIKPETTPELPPAPVGKGELGNTQNAGTRVGLKHIGGYFDREMVEKVAVLRARLDLDNSTLIKLAIDDLYRKQMAKRAFGDE